ncbi:MAG TPA: hypothetical protein VFX89_15990 [Gammaproteobacteria bacterium]|nr:hypothetical protein [Gammaproteobacteria bacterium]
MSSGSSVNAESIGQGAGIAMGIAIGCGLGYALSQRKPPRAGN